MWSVYWSWARCYNHNVLNHCGIPQLGLQCRSTHPPRVSVPFHTLEGASRTGRQFPLPPFLPSLPSCLIAIAGTLVVIFITSNLTIALFFQLIFFKSLATLIQLTRGHQIYFYEISLNLCLFFFYIYIQMLLVKALHYLQCQPFILVFKCPLKGDWPWYHPEVLWLNPTSS